jgi:hypothetical protein
MKAFRRQHADPFIQAMLLQHLKNLHGWILPPLVISDLRRCGALLTSEGPWPSVLTETA